MAFTGQLGVTDSKLGNIELGTVGSTTSTYNDSLNIDGFSAVTISNIASLHHTLSVDCTAAFTLSTFNNYVQALTIAGFSAAEVKIPYQLVLTVSGIAAFTVLPGQQYFNFAAIEGISDITLTPGKGYFDTVSVDCISDIAEDQLAFTLLSLSIDGIAAITESTLQNGRIALSIDGIAALTVTPNFSYVISFSLNGISTIYESSSLNASGTDGLYNFMALTSNDTLDVALQRAAAGNENPSAVGSISVACTGIFNRTITQTLTLGQIVVHKKPTEIVDTFHIVSQTVNVQRVRNRSITQTVVFTHDAQGYRAFSQSIVFVGSAIVTKVMFRTVNQTLSLTQSANRTTVLNRSFSQTLTMGQNRLVHAPIIGTINTSNPTGFDYYRPVAQVILVPNRCLVILGVPTKTIIMPCPQFGDTQAGESTLNLKRTMTGDTFTYVRKTELQRLKYTFQIGTYKAIELQDFLLNHCHEVITLINHKGETWYVNLSNNPFEFAVAERWQSKGERHDITLEFEGVQL